MLSRQFESDLHAALDEVAAEVPDDVGQRLRRRSYHRGPRPLVSVAVTAAVAAAVVVAVIASGLGSSGGRTNVGANGSWKLVSYLDSSWHRAPASGYEEGWRLTCPSTSTCYALQSPVPDSGPAWIEVTRDGGATWHQSMLPDGLTPETDTIACANPTSCAMVVNSPGGDFEFITTADGARSWAVHPGPTGLPRNFSLSDLSCSTATSCVAVGAPGYGAHDTVGRAFVTADGWRTWSELPLAPSFDPGWVQCFAGGRCIVTGLQSVGPEAHGAVMYSTDSGTSWTYATVPTGLAAFGHVTPISCGDELHCVMVGDRVSLASGRVTGDTIVALATSDGGQSWTRTTDRNLPGPFAPLSCGDAVHCWAGQVAAGARLPLVKDLVSTADQGQSWTTTHLPPSLHILNVSSISCPTASRCFALADTGPEPKPVLRLGQHPRHNTSVRPVLLAFGK
jgi:photosystem II stability/assembly factor-like uncharacterized protein